MEEHNRKIQELRCAIKDDIFLEDLKEVSGDKMSVYKLREDIARLAYDQWSGWMEYLFSKCSEEEKCSSFAKTGGIIIPKEYFDRWRIQLILPYDELPEEEKKFHRKEADKFINLLKENSGQISDGFHTFDQLYEHRIVLFIKLCETIYNNEFVVENSIWRSKKHSDGTGYDGWFIMGINKEKGEQMSYHLPLKYWEMTEFAETLDKAPGWDGHTSDDVIDRLFKL